MQGTIDTLLSQARSWSNNTFLDVIITDCGSSGDSLFLLLSFSTSLSCLCLIVLYRKDLATKEANSTESSNSSWSREETSPGGMELEVGRHLQPTRVSILRLEWKTMYLLFPNKARASMETVSPMRTLSWSTTAPAGSAWPTPAKIPTAPSSSSPPWWPAGWTASTSSLEKFWRGRWVAWPGGSLQGCGREIDGYFIELQEKDAFTAVWESNWCNKRRAIF